MTLQPADSHLCDREHYRKDTSGHENGQKQTVDGGGGNIELYIHRLSGIQKRHSKLRNKGEGRYIRKERAAYANMRLFRFPKRHRCTQLGNVEQGLLLIQWSDSLQLPQTGCVLFLDLSLVLCQLKTKEYLRMYNTSIRHEKTKVTYLTSIFTPLKLMHQTSHASSSH